MPCISQTLVGFVYPLSVSFFPIPQVLFHTWNAHGVSLSELFAVLKAVTLSGPLLLCGSLSDSFRITNNSMKTGNWRFGVLLLEQSSTLYERCYVSHKASCSLRVLTSKVIAQAMESASWFLLFCSYFDTFGFRQLSKICFRVFFAWMLHDLFRFHATFLVFITAFFPRDLEMKGFWIIYSPEISTSIATVKNFTGIRLRTSCRSSLGDKVRCQT
jgi:hypothetical protein